MRIRFDEYHVDGDRRYDVIRYTHLDDYEPGYLTLGKHYKEETIGTISYYWGYGDWYFRGNDLNSSQMKLFADFMEKIPSPTKAESESHDAYKGDPLAR